MSNPGTLRDLAVASWMDVEMDLCDSAARLVSVGYVFWSIDNPKQKPEAEADIQQKVSWGQDLAGGTSKNTETPSAS